MQHTIKTGMPETIRRAVCWEDSNIEVLQDMSKTTSQRSAHRQKRAHSRRTLLCGDGEVEEAAVGGAGGPGGAAGRGPAGLGGVARAEGVGRVLARVVGARRALGRADAAVCIPHWLHRRHMCHGLRNMHAHRQRASCSPGQLSLPGWAACLIRNLAINTLVIR